MGSNIQIIWAFFIAAMVLAAVGIGLLASMIIGQRRFLNAERRRMREREKAEHRYRNLFNSVSDIIYSHSDDGFIRLINKSVKTHLGAEPEELIGKNLRDLLPDRAAREFDSYLKRIEERGWDQGILRLRTAQGAWVFLEYESSRTEQEEGESGIRGICRNVTKRIEAVRFRKKNEHRFRQFVSSSQVPTVIERLGTMLYANAAAASLFGVGRPEELIGKDLFVYFDHSRDSVKHDQLIHQLTCHERTPIIDTQLRRHSGEIRDVAVSAVPVLFEGEIAAHVVFDDITERIRTAQELAEEKERLAMTLQSIHDGVIAADLDGKIVLMSRSAEEMIGITAEDAIGSNIEDICILRNVGDEQALNGYVDHIIRGEDFLGGRNEGFLISRDGSRRLITTNGVPIVNRRNEEVGIILAFRDITERKRFEKELVQSAKMESIGLLAGGLAHDFNNILASILGSITVATELVPFQESVGEMLVDAKQGVLRARDLTRQLVTISSGGSLVRQTADISEVISESVNLSLRGSNAKALLDLPDDLMSVRADVSQLSQVFTNLLLNAVQAMPMGGEIRIYGSNVISGDDSPGSVPFVRIDIEDQGIGISHEHITHIFEPFYTTKDKGTGLGLASVYSVINSHGGRIEVESQPGEGTRFSVFLPATDEEVKREARADSSLSVGRDLRALVIDDDVAVLRSMKRMLTLIGIRSSTADAAEQAIAIFASAIENSDPFEVVFLDLKIPGGPSGMEIIGHLLDADPTIKVVAISAHLYTLERKDLDERGFWAYLAKPFTLDELKAIVAALPRKDQT